MVTEESPFDQLSSLLTAVAGNSMSYDYGDSLHYDEDDTEGSLHIGLASPPPPPAFDFLVKLINLVIYCLNRISPHFIGRITWGSL